MATSTIIRIPANERDFEENCVPLFAGHLNDPNVKTVGSRGFGQKGLDLIGARDRDANQPVGIQCKLRTKGDKLTEKQVREEVGMALTVEPKLTEYYIVTTASDDPVMDLLAMQIRQEQTRLGRTIDIQIWGWETTQQHIRRHRKAQEAFDPGHSAASEALLELSAETNQLVRDQASLTITAITEIQTQVSAIPRDPGRGSALDAHLDDQIDQYRDLINASQPQTALALLTRLEEKLGANASSAIRARIRANIGWCQLRLGSDELAGRLLLEAYVLNPADPKVIANRVLGLILTDDVARAAAFGQEELAKDPGNSGLAAFLYQAATISPGVIDPDAVVPDALKSELAVMIHRTSFHRSRDETQQWRSLAAQTAKAYPGDDAAARLSAEAMIDEALEDRAFERNPVSSPFKDALLTDAAAILDRLWDKARKSEIPGQEHLLTIGVNLANAYRARMMPTEAKAVIDQALAVAPDNPDVVGTAMFIALEEDNSQAAADFARRLPEGPLRSVHLLNTLSRLRDWAGLIAEATPERGEALPPEDRRAFDSLLYRARINSGAETDIEAASDALAAAWPHSIATLVVVSDALREINVEKSDGLFQMAVEQLDETTPYGDRLMLAELANFRGNSEDVIRCLDGYVRIDRVSAPLTTLAVAFANAPPRPRTHRFFEDLPKAIIETGRYARLAGVAEASRGDLVRAEHHLRVAVTEDPTDLRAHMQLHSVLKRRKLDETARDHLVGIDENSQVGSAADLMRLAQLLISAQEMERGLALGYRVARANPRNPDIVAVYPPMILMAGDLPASVADDGPATEGFWFDLQGQGIDDVEGVIERAVGGENYYAPDHPLAQALIGKSVGETIVLPRDLGPDQTYTIRALSHKYLWLMREIMRRHAAWFPDSNSFVSLSIQNDDIQPILDMVKQLSRQDELIAATYANSPVPLSVIAAISRKSVIELAEHLPSIDSQLRACAGNLPERQLALRHIKAARGRGAVLDTLTVWVARQMKLLPSLKAYFGRLVVPRSTIDTLLELRGQRELHRGQEYMTVGYQGEQAVRSIQPPEATEAALALFDETISEIEACCEVMPNDGADDLNLDSDTISRLAEGDVLDPIHLVRRENLFLLSEDLHLRQWAAAYGAKRSAWLQPVAITLVEAGLIGEADYVLALGQLAARRHGHVWLDVDALKAISRFDDPRRGEAIFQAVLAYIGGPTADMRSHVAVVADFMRAYVSGHVAGPSPGRAVDALLTQLLKGQEQWRLILVTLDRALRDRKSNIDQSADLARYYLGNWLRGHFLTEAFVELAPFDTQSSTRARRRQRKRRRA